MFVWRDERTPSESHPTKARLRPAKKLNHKKPNAVLSLILFAHLLGSIRPEHLDPMRQGLCSDYLLPDLISSSVSTFQQLWVTSERVSSRDRNSLTFVTYLDNWLRRDGAPNMEEELQTLTCPDFGKMQVICKFELEFLRLKHILFDGIYTYLFLQNQSNRIWRVIVLEVKTGNVLLFDSFTNCEKRRNKKKIAYYKQLFCVLEQHMDMDQLNGLLMMNLDTKTELERSSFEVWCFFKNQTMSKIRFPDRQGTYQIINLKMSSPANFVTLASVQFVSNRFQLLNASYGDTFAKPEKRLVHPFLSDRDELTRSKRSPRQHYHLHYHSTDQLNSNGHRKKRPKKHRKKKHHRKRRKRPKIVYFEDGPIDDSSGPVAEYKSKKSIDFHLNRMVQGLTAYLSSFNLTLDSALNKLKSIKAKTINSLFPYKQSEVVLFHKHYATFHSVESNFFVQPAMQPYVQPNQIYLGCPQPFCFLTTIDDLTFNPLTKELLIFRNQFYWTYQISDRQGRANRRLPYIQIQFPKLSSARLISSNDRDARLQSAESIFPKEFPMYIDAATYVIVDSFYYLLAIKDGWVYVYIPQTKKLVPVLLTDYFDERMTLSRVDAMFFQNKQLFVFSENNYWLYDLLDSFRLRFNNRGVMFRNLPGSLDAAYVLNNRFYFFKQNFFYLNDAAGNSLIHPQLVHDTFLVGCDKSRLPAEVDMSRLFRAPQLINYYCMRCPGYLVDRLKDKWNWNNNTFVTVKLPGEEDYDEKTSIVVEMPTEPPKKEDERERVKGGKILQFPTFNEKPISPVDEFTESQTDSDLTTKRMEEDKTAKLGLTNAFAKLDKFVWSWWTFLTHHVLFGLLLLFGVLFVIFLCQRRRESLSALDDRPDEDLLDRKGRARRKEMRRRNRRWN